MTFPENYHVEDLKGKPAVFKVTIKEIQRKELPEVNDEFASEVSDFDTLEEYKKDLREKLSKEKQRAAATENENRVVDKVVENASMEIPDQMVEEQVNAMVNDYAAPAREPGPFLQAVSGVHRTDRREDRRADEAAGRKENRDETRS